MYKIKKTLVSILCLLPLIAFAKEKYNPDDVAKFKATHVCIKCDLSYEAFDEGQYENVNVQGSNLKRVDLNHSEIYNANFSDINGEELYLCGDSLGGSSFKNAKLTDARFLNSELSDTDFSGADVTRAYFNGANLSGSNITPAQLATASSVCGATLPDGSTGKCNGNVTNN